MHDSLTARKGRLMILGQCDDKRNRWILSTRRRTQCATYDVQLDCQIWVRWNQQSLKNPSANCGNVPQDHH